MTYCKICGKWDCEEHQFNLGKTVSIKEFSGSSPPEIFVGKWNYPNVYAGILSPTQYGDTRILSSSEIWHEKKLPIHEIVSLRQKLIYGRSRTHIKKRDDRFLSVMKEVAMTHKSVATEFKLKSPVKQNPEREPNSPLISRVVFVQNVSLLENPSVKSKVDYLVNDTEAKSKTAMLELEKSNIDTSSIIKLLSAGLLGLKKNRKLVPTKWAITAVDDTLSKNKLKKIRYFNEISEIQLFNAEYLGNHYEFLLLPDKFSFEVIEISLTNLGVWRDYESFFDRKSYAEDVSGAYYVNRLALTEYLEKIKRQASCIVFREIRPEYNTPMGVGILRETSREAFSQKPQRFNTIPEALNAIQSRLKLPINNFTQNSIILKNYGKQKRLSEFL